MGRVSEVLEEESEEAVSDGTDGPLVIHWVSTAATQSDGFTPRGWKLHAIEAPEKVTFREAKAQRSKCNMSPRLWGLDLHIDKKCAPCLRALDLDCKACRGVGSTGKPSKSTWKLCYECHGTGERR